MAPTPAPGRIPLAVAILDGAGVISHWNADARRLFGIPPEDAVGRSAYEVLPASSTGSAAVEVRVEITMDTLADADAAMADALEAAVARAEKRALDPAFDAVDDEIAHLDPDRGVEILFGADVTDLTVPSSGRYWTQASADEPGPRDVLWWICPLLGPGGARLLVIATDGALLAAPGGPAHRTQSFGPTFAPHTAFDPPLDRPGPLAERLLAMLPEMGEAAGGRVAEQVLDMGYPALDLGGGRVVPLTPGGD